MPLSPPVTRKHFHTRRILCESFKRADGLWDIEAHLVDDKTYDFTNYDRGEIKAGDPVHDMWLRVTLDDAFLIHRVEAVTDASPYNICPEVTPNFRRLEGHIIGRGWKQLIRESVGGTKGCTHLVDMLSVVSVVAFQTIMTRQLDVDDHGVKSGIKPPHFDTCYALDTTGPVVKHHYPKWYRDPSRPEDTKEED